MASHDAANETCRAFGPLAGICCPQQARPRERSGTAGGGGVQAQGAHAGATFRPEARLVVWLGLGSAARSPVRPSAASICAGPIALLLSASPASKTSTNCFRSLACSFLRRLLSRRCVDVWSVCLFFLCPLLLPPNIHCHFALRSRYTYTLASAQRVLDSRPAIGILREPYILEGPT